MRSARDLVFFFQAEDGIRDVAVTGVQTCALPISGDRGRGGLGRPGFGGVARSAAAAGPGVRSRAGRGACRSWHPRRERRRRRRGAAARGALGIARRGGSARAGTWSHGNDRPARALRVARRGATAPCRPLYRDRPSSRRPARDDPVAAAPRQRARRARRHGGTGARRTGAPSAAVHESGARGLRRRPRAAQPRRSRKPRSEAPAHLGAPDARPARAALGRYDPALAVALLRAAARRAGLVLGMRRARALVRFAERPSGRRLSLGGGWVAEVGFDRLAVARSRAAAPEPVVATAERGSAQFGTYRVEWTPERAPARLPRDEWTTWIQGGDWEIRFPRAGERLVPLGAVGHRRVRRLLMEARVPRSDRASYPIVARGETILWVPGICRSAAELPQPGTRAVRLDVTRHGEPQADRRT